MGRSAWLVDMAYVVKAAKKTGLKVDYVAAREVVAERYGDVDAFLFNSYDEAYGIPDGLKAFYYAMEQQGMVVRLHPMTGDASAGSHRQRRVDVDLACHAVWQASLGGVDRLVLTTGDQDLIPAVEMCRHRFGMALTLLTFRYAVSHALVDAVDEQILFEDHRDRLER